MKKLLDEYRALMQVFGAIEIETYFDNFENFANQRSVKSLNVIISEIANN